MIDQTTKELLSQAWDQHHAAYLVHRRVFNADLAVGTFRLQLQFHVQSQHFRILVLLFHRLKTSVRESFLECDTTHQKAADMSHGAIKRRVRLKMCTYTLPLSDGAARNFFDPNKSEGHILVQTGDCVHDHRAKEFTVSPDQLGVERGHGTSLK